MQALIPWFVTLQAAAMLPALDVGAEARIVSADLMRVFLVGQVDEARMLRLEGEVPLPGSEGRLLVFPPDADAEQDAATASGAAALVVRIDRNGTLQIVEEAGPVPLHEAFARRGVRLLLPGEEAP